MYETWNGSHCLSRVNKEVKYVCAWWRCKVISSLPYKSRVNSQILILTLKSASYYEQYLSCELRFLIQSNRLFLFTQKHYINVGSFYTDDLFKQVWYCVTFRCGYCTLVCDLACESITLLGYSTLTFLQFSY